MKAASRPPSPLTPPASRAAAIPPLRQLVLGCEGWKGIGNAGDLGMACKLIGGQLGALSVICLTRSGSVSMPCSNTHIERRQRRRLPEQANVDVPSIQRLAAQHHAAQRPARPSTTWSLNTTTVAPAAAAPQHRRSEDVVDDQLGAVAPWQFFATAAISTVRASGSAGVLDEHAPWAFCMAPSSSGRAIHQGRRHAPSGASGPRPHSAAARTGRAHATTRSPCMDLARSLCRRQPPTCRWRGPGGSAPFRERAHPVPADFHGQEKRRVAGGTC